MSSEITNDSYSYTKSWATTYTVAMVLCVALVITIPIAIFLFVKTRSAKIAFDGSGFTVSGIGPTRRWEFGALQRVGTMTVHVVGNPIFALINGGSTATHLLARTKEGKKLSCILSRFERSGEILERVQQATGLPLEPIKAGFTGPVWPEHAS